MNILISTTTNHNSGDDFIRIGVKNILKHVFPKKPNYIHFDRNPNNMVDWPANQNIRKGLRGTFMNKPINWKKIDLVVMAGSPEFLHHPLAPIYEGLAEHPEIPLWCIGVGYSEPKFVVHFTNAELKVLERKSTLIISRQEELSVRLRFVFNQTVHTLPCPALFCFEKFPEKTRGSLTPYQIAHSLDELTEDTYFDSDPNEMLNHIGSHSFIITHRLHGAIAGISSGAFVDLINDSFRCREAIRLFEDVMQTGRENITAFKIRILNNYINILKEHYDKTYPR